LEIVAEGLPVGRSVRILSVGWGVGWVLVSISVIKIGLAVGFFVVKVAVVGAGTTSPVVEASVPSTVGA
jgi:hypothetical protein